MEDNKHIQPKQGHTTDPQEDEKDGNILGGLFDKVFGNFDGDESISEEERKEPGKQGSIKEDIDSKD